MFDYYLKFEDEAQAMSVLYSKEGVVEANEEQGIEGSAGYLRPLFDNIDIIGTIYDPTGETEVIDWMEVSVMKPLDGFHVNVRNYTETNELDAYLVFPNNPRRVWA